MPLNGVPQSVRGRMFDIQFTLRKDASGHKVWDLKWMSKAAKQTDQPEGQSTIDVINQAGLEGVPIDYNNDIIQYKGVGDVLEDCAEKGVQPPEFTPEIIEFITKFKVRLMPLAEADLVINSLFYLDYIKDLKGAFTKILFEHSEDEAVPFWAGVYFECRYGAEYDENGLPLVKDFTLRPLQDDRHFQDMGYDDEPWKTWLEEWQKRGNPAEITRDFAYPAIVVLREGRFDPYARDRNKPRDDSRGYSDSDDD